MDRFNASWRAGVRSEPSGFLDIGGGLLPTPTLPIVPPVRSAGDRGLVSRTSLGKPFLGLGEVLSWKDLGEGG